MQIEVGTQKSKIFTDNPKLLSALVTLYSFRVPGAEYSRNYRSHRWNGTKQFITNGGTFRTGLLPRILADLEKVECTPEIIDKTGSLDLADHQIEGFDLYDYQEEFIEKIRQEKRGVVKSPTGSGKTLIMAAAVQALRKQGRKIVILFNAKQLLTQTYEFFTEVCHFDSVGLCFGDGFIEGDIMLCTVQSIEHIIDSHVGQAEVLMVDECHEFCNGKLTLGALQSFPNADYRIGFTATPPSDDIGRHNLEGALGRVWEVVQTADLVDDGTLTKPLIHRVRRKYKAAGADIEMDYQTAYETYIVENEERNQKILDIVAQIMVEHKKPRILILTKSLAHGEWLMDKLGNTCRYIEGANSLGERYQAIDWFRKNPEGTVLIGTKILQTGVNIQEVTHLINARGMKSEIATLQALGRALRKHESKEQVYIYDFADEERYLKDHSKSRFSYYRKEGHEIKDYEEDQ
jgi:superfamily II DNA or RNA helicase